MRPKLLDLLWMRGWIYDLTLVGQKAERLDYGGLPALVKAHEGILPLREALLFAGGLTRVPPLPTPAKHRALRLG